LFILTFAVIGLSVFFYISGMKKILLFLSVFLSASLFGQTHFVGFKGGINFANFFERTPEEDGIDDGIQNNRNGFNGGLSYLYHFNERINFGVDLLYSQRGGTYSGSGNSSVVQSVLEQHKLDYLSVPIKGGIVYGDLFSFFTNVGLIPSYLLKHNVLLEITYIDGALISFPISEYSEDENVNLEDRNRFDIAGLIEAGVNYKLNSNLLLHTTLGYQYTFTDYNFNISGGYRNRGIVLHFGIKYALNAE